MLLKRLIIISLAHIDKLNNETFDYNEYFSTFFPDSNNNEAFKQEMP